MFGYKVEITSRCDYSESSGERYGSWSKEYTNSFGSIRKNTTKDNYPDVLSLFDFPDGKDVFVVWLEYSTGDSFGNATRGSKEVLGVFETLEPARELALALEESGKKDTDTGRQHEFDFVTSDGQHFKLDYIPWLGYFEKLEEVHVDVAVMGKKAGKGWWR